MVESIGTYGKMAVYEHFLGFMTTTMSTTALPVGSNGVNYVSVNEGSFATTVDEPGGVLAITSDTADDDNCFLYIGPFKPADGGCWMEARFKQADADDNAVYVGFTETLDATTPVCPAEYAATTLTCNGTGGMIGALYDADATTDEWLAVAGDGGAAKTNIAGDTAPTHTSQTAVDDEYDVVRAEIYPSGGGAVWIASKGGGLNCIAEYPAGTLTPTDLQYAVVGFENRSAGANVFEVDYFNAGSFVDWTR